MGSPKVTLTFEDGNVEEVTLNPRVLVEVERKFGTVPPIEGTYWGAWFRLGRPGGNFDAWLDTVSDMEQTAEGSADPS